MATYVGNGSKEVTAIMVEEALKDHLKGNKINRSAMSGYDKKVLNDPSKSKQLFIKAIMKLKKMIENEKADMNFGFYISTNSYKNLSLKERDQLVDNVSAERDATYYIMASIIKNQSELEELIDYYPNKYSVNTSHSYNLYKVIGKEEIIRKIIFFYIDNYDAIHEKIESFKCNDKKLNIAVNNFLVFEISTALGYATRIGDKQKEKQAREIVENLNYQNERNKNDYIFRPGTLFNYTEYRLDSTNY